ncbi:TPA: PepSY domain-containing protein [Bacillus toyonensis]|nr:PepSY domain-containing protein [Bacillus toyonensis]
MKLWIGMITVLLITGGTVYGVNAMEHEEIQYEESIEKDYASKELSPETAKQIAIENVNGVVKEVDLEDDYDNSVYEIEVETNVGEEEIYVDAKSGNVISEKEFDFIKSDEEDDQDEDTIDNDNLDD